MLDSQPQSLQGLLDATSWLEPREGGLFRSLNHGWLADGMASTGRFREVRHHAARTLLRARQHDLIGVAMAYRALARCAGAARDHPRAEHYLSSAIRTANARESAHELAVTELCAAAIAAAAGDRSRALARLDRAIPAFEAMQMRWHLAQALRLSDEL